jgi:hypothetical protein
LTIAGGGASGDPLPVRQPKDIGRRSKHLKTHDDKNLVALAGEYHVLAQLSERGIVGALTLGHTKGIDILAHNPSTGRMRRVEVKSTRQGPGPARLWHPNSAAAHSWTMSEKHEALNDEDLLFCFVQLSGAASPPRIFVVPAAEVASYVKWEHALWLKSGKNGPRPENKENKMRRFRIEESDPNDYQNKWGLFD